MQCQKHWSFSAELRKLTQVKVIWMQVVAMDDVGSRRWKPEDSSGCRVIEIFYTQQFFDLATRIFTEGRDSPHPGYSTHQGLQFSFQPAAETAPKGRMPTVGNLYYSRIATTL